MAQPPVMTYTLSTCHHCKAAKKFLTGCGVAFEFTDVDQLTGAEREAMIAEVRRQAQEPQGYFFNADEALVAELLEAPIVTSTSGRRAGTRSAWRPGSRAGDG